MTVGVAPLVTAPVAAAALPYVKHTRPTGIFPGMVASSAGTYQCHANMQTALRDVERRGWEGESRVTLALN